MKPNDLPMNPSLAPAWTLAQRAHRLNPSVLREILKVTEKPGIISFAGGLPSPRTFPIDAFAAACAKVLGTDGASALQYAASEGYVPLREAIADFLACAVIGGPQAVREGLQALAKQTGCDEMMFVCDVFDPALRLRALDIAAEVTKNDGAVSKS